MNCINCYREISDDAKFCPYCGAKQVEKPEPGQENRQQDYQGNQQGNQEDFRQGYQGDFQQDYQGYQQDYPKKPVSWVPYLVLSIIFTAGSAVCCCPLSLVFGIVAIVYSVKINQASAAGDEEGARRAARTAMIWLIVSGVVLVLSIIMSAVFGAVLFEEIYDTAYYEYYY